VKNCTKTMLSFVVVLLILGLAGVSNGAAIDSASKHVSNELIIPRGQTREEYLQTIIDYWTPERMASAQPMEPVIANNDELVRFANHQKDDGVEQILTPSASLPDTRSTRPSTAGKVYFVMNGGNYLCSAAVVNANNRDTITTAGHCIFDTGSRTWASNWIFVPQYSLGSRPLGTYTWREMVTTTGWANNADFHYDVGLVLVHQNDRGQHVQDMTGGLGITLNPSREAWTNAFGYPVNMNNGETMSTCASTSLDPTNAHGFSGMQLPCGMTGGASGGPWIHEYNTNTQLGQQVSVNSFIFLNHPGHMFGPRFNDDNIGSIYHTYKDK